MNDWREEPATKKQIRYLKELNISHPTSISKGLASELISKALPAEDFQVEILRFFRVKGAAKLNSFAAGQAVQELLEDPDNKKKWEDRRCNAEQKAILTFFDMPISKGLKFREADRLIGILFENDAMMEKWDAHEDAMAEREDWFDYARDDLNDRAEDFDCKKLSAARFKSVVTKLESQGMSLEDIEFADEAFFSEALLQFPGIKRK